MPGLSRNCYAHLQVVERLSKASEKRDLLVLNFGLHFSETYKEELEQLVQQVGSLHNLVAGIMGCDNERMQAVNGPLLQHHLLQKGPSILHICCLHQSSRIFRHASEHEGGVGLCRCCSCEERATSHSCCGRTLRLSTSSPPLGSTLK